MFLLPAFAALRSVHDPVLSDIRLDFWWKVAVFSLTIVIGYRFQIGGDWFSYQYTNYRIGGGSLQSALLEKDPSYGALNWLSTKLGWGIYGVNLTCGFLFSWGLAKFCCQQPHRALALVVAIPYLVIVVAMGYTRQGASIGLVLLALTYLTRGNQLYFALLVAIAATFHKSAIIMIPLAALASTRKRAWSMTLARIWSTVWIGAMAILLYLLLVAEQFDNLYTNYIDAKYQSQGASVRIAMNLVPSIIYLLFRNKFNLNEEERSLWSWLSLSSLAFFILLMFSPYTTAIDRLALYMIPLQLFVFSRLPDIFGFRSGRRNYFLTLAVLFYYACIQFTWLNYAAHAHSWVPYKFYPIE